MKGSLETIRSTAAKLIETIDGHFAEIQQEKAAVQEQEQEAQPITPELQPAQEQPEQATPQEAAPREAEAARLKYYPINEAAAARAKEMNSYSDYKPVVQRRIPQLCRGGRTACRAAESAGRTRCTMRKSTVCLIPTPGNLRRI